jgi:predicted MarR family transcription regulator
MTETRDLDGGALASGSNGGSPPAQRELYDRHLSTDAQAAALTRLEMSALRSVEALSSWATELHKLATAAPIGFQEAALLHCLRLRGSSATLAEMLIFLHRHDLAALQYNFRKLETQGLIRRARGASRREVSYTVTDKGREVTDQYAAARQRVLVRLCAEVVGLDKAMTDAAGVLERLTSLYDLATQSLMSHQFISPEDGVTPPAAVFAAGAALPSSAEDVAKR